MEIVTPLAGVWIEMLQVSGFPRFVEVTPLAGVWIEILYRPMESTGLLCHSPCGSVD